MEEPPKYNKFDLPNTWKFSHFLQSIPIFIFYGFFWCLPLDWASAIGGWIGRTVGPRLGASRKARGNLELALPEIKEQHDDLIRQMWNNIGRTAAEAAHTHKFSSNNYIDVAGVENITTLKDQGIPAIMFGSHSANWELPPIMLEQNNIPIAVVYRPPNNLFVDWLLKRSRNSLGATLLPKGKDAARGVLKALRNKEYVGWLTDQKEGTGIKANFFGQPAYTSTAAAEVAIKTGAKLVPCHVERTKGARFKVTVLKPLETDGKSIEEITQMMNDALEDGIRKNPGQWLWLHRRWTV